LVLSPLIPLDGFAWAPHPLANLVPGTYALEGVLCSFAS